MDEQGQYERVCKDRFDEMMAMLRSIDVSLRGNGNPGVMTRLDRLERAQAVQAKLFWLFCAAAIAAFVRSFF